MGTPVSPIVCKRRSPLLLPPPLRSRSLLPLSVSTPSGSVDPSCPPSPLSNRCGSPSKNTTNAAPPLSTGSASKRIPQSKNYHHKFYNLANYSNILLFLLYLLLLLEVKVILTICNNESL